MKHDGDLPCHKIALDHMCIWYLFPIQLAYLNNLKATSV